MSAAPARRFPTALVLAGTAVMFVIGIGWAIFSTLSRQPAAGSVQSPLRAESGPLPQLGEVPDFTLISESGAKFGRSDLAGSPWVADFIFTTCAGVCRMMSTQMARLQDELPASSRLRLVSITVDPGHDTPEVLKEYAERYGARPERWVFLTGDPEAVYRLSMEGFRLAAGEQPDWRPGVDDGPFYHSTRMVLVDAGGRIRGYYDGTDPEELGRLRADLDRLERSPPA